METLGQAMANRGLMPTGVTSAVQRTPQLSPDLQRKIMLVRERFGDKKQFLTDFNPMAQIQAAKNPERAFFGTAPSLALLKHTYGENTPAMWVIPQLFDLCEFTGVKKMDEQQAEYLAEIISLEYGYLKVTELMVFFYRFKLGRYGRFYGSVDPMVILTALKEFLKERDQEIVRKEAEDREKELAEHSKNAITPQEYCRRKGYPEMTDILDIINYEVGHR